MPRRRPARVAGPSPPRQHVAAQSPASADTSCRLAALYVHAWLAPPLQAHASSGLPALPDWLGTSRQEPATPALAAWYARLLERPAFREYVALPLS